VELQKVSMSHVAEFCSIAAAPRRRGPLIPDHARPPRMIARAAPMLPSLAILLRLGRVSNLPTVWTDVLAASALAGSHLLAGSTLLVMAAMSLFYIGGMYLNDAFDRAIDAVERPARPIPAKLISARWVFAAGFALLAAGLALMCLAGRLAGLAGLALAGTIVFYDAHHKGNPLSPLVMGACRALVYVGAGLAVSGNIPSLLQLGALGVLAHVAGLTYAARQEAFDRIERLWPLLLLLLPVALSIGATQLGPVGIAAWLALAAADLFAVALLARRGAAGRVRRAVVTLIAAISLVDASFAGSAGNFAVALMCAAGFGLTLLAQRAIAGT
jgi:4-hydroxybenzoate polyprenyltransferase